TPPTFVLSQDQTLQESGPREALAPQKPTPGRPGEEAPGPSCQDLRSPCDRLKELAGQRLAPLPQGQWSAVRRATPSLWLVGATELSKIKRKVAVPKVPQPVQKDEPALGSAHPTNNWTA